MDKLLIGAKVDLGNEAVFRCVKQLLGAKETLNLLDALMESSFFEDPSSARYHDACAGGLALHSFKVWKCCMNLADDFGIEKKESERRQMTVAALCHDVCKIGKYVTEERWKKTPDNKWESYTAYKYKEGLMSYGHGMDSVLWIERYFMLDEPWKLAVRYHMGAFIEQDKRDFFEAAKKYPHVLLLSSADMMATCDWFKLEGV